MYKLFVIAKNNIKKQKGDMITFFILTFIAAFLIFDAASAILGTNKELDRRFEEVNGVHLMLFSHDTEEEKECIEKAIKEHEYITDFESNPCIIMTAEHKKAGDNVYSQYQMIVSSFDNKPKYMHDIPEGESYAENDVVLPYNLKGTYSVGDVMQIKLGDSVYDFNVAGYASDPYFCSRVNVTIYYMFMSDKMMDRLKTEEPDYAIASIQNKGLMDESYLTKDYTTAELEKEITDRYKELLAPYMAEHPERNYTNYLCVNWQMMRGGSAFIPLIIMAILLLFAVIIVVIAIVIISFSIKNFIQRNMKNTGILEASGYTVSELRHALSFQIVSISLLGSVLGTLTAVLTFKYFTNVVSLALGMEWNQPVNMLLVLITIAVPAALLYLVSRIISRSYNKITVLDALRGGINNHNYKKNIFSFEKTPLPIPAVISLKETFSGAGRNLIMVFIVVVITLSVLIGFGMYENFGENPKKIIDIFGFEDATMIVATNEDISDELRDLNNVENVLPMFGLDLTAKAGDKNKSFYTYAADNLENATNLVVLEGRIAKHDNEIMLTGGAASDLGVEVGDVVEIEYSGKNEEYIVVGKFQRMDHMGRTIYMTFDGIKRLTSGISLIQYYVTAKEGVTYDTLLSDVKKIEEKYGTTFTYVDGARQMEETLGVVGVAMKTLCIVIVIITVLIVIFVESLVIRAKIVREWKGMGISKALGMTSGDLIIQIMISNVPAIIAGVLIGALLSQYAGSKLCVAIFSLFGINHIDFNISIVWMLLSAVGILAVALLASGLAGLKVRKLRPVEMITEE